MKRHLLTLLATILCLSAVQAERIYVVQNAEGDGSSWESAFGTIQEALAIAQEGDELWVAAGTYTPSDEADRFASFAIPSGVALYGGFQGTEEELDERNPAEYRTILSGELGDADSDEDNSYTVVYFHHANAQTILDGVTISGGAADGYADGADLTTCGAAIFNDGENGTSSPKINNCVFLYNYSREGAAIYNYANEGVASPTISDCKFLYNRSDFNGGAIFNDGNFGLSNPTIINCRFEGNESTYGAGILNRGLYGECKPTITDCFFFDNFSIVRGSAVYNDRNGRGICEATITGCVFEENGSTVGHDVDNTMTDESDARQRSGAGLQLRDSAISY